MDRYYSFLLSSFCGVHLRRGEVGGGVCCASLGLQMGKTRQKCVNRRNFTSFSSKLRQILIISISGKCKLFVIKIFQTVVGITDASISPSFLKSIFGGFFPIWPNCAPEEKNDLTYAANEDFHYLYLTSMYVL